MVHAEDVLSSIPVISITAVKISTSQSSATVFVGESNYSYIPLWTYFTEVFLVVLLMFGIMFNWIISDQMFVNPELYFYAKCKL